MFVSNNQTNDPLNDPRFHKVTLVTPQDEVLGELDRYVAHRYPAQLHRASSVWMKDESGRLLLQRRSVKKIIGATWWNNTICGNVWPEESYEECAKRRLFVELGIPLAEIEKMTLQPVKKFHYKSYANETYGEHEMDQVFVVKVIAADVTLQLNPDEVSEVVWVKIEDFFAEMERVLTEFRIQSGRQYPLASQTVAMTFDELKRWTQSLQLQLGGELRTVVPWTILMAQLPELQEALRNV